MDTVKFKLVEDTVKFKLVVHTVKFKLVMDLKIIIFCLKVVDRRRLRCREYVADTWPK